MCYTHSPVTLNCLQITTMTNKRQMLYKYLLIVFLETDSKISVHIQYSFFQNIFDSQLVKSTDAESMELRTGCT